MRTRFNLVDRSSLEATSALLEPEDAASADAPLKRDLIAGLEKGLPVIAAFDQDRPRLTMSEVAAHAA